MKRKKKRKSPRAVYKVAKRGGARRRTALLRGPVYKRSRRGKVRRVRRANPGFPSVLGAAAAGFAAHVAVRVGSQLAAPGSAMARLGAAAAALAAGVFAASKGHPEIGAGIAAGAALAAYGNDAVFKAEMMLAPAATQQALGAIEYNNLRGLPSYAKMGAMQNARSLPQYAKMGAIVSNNMAGFGDPTIASMRVHNPFE